MKALLLLALVCQQDPVAAAVKKLRAATGSRMSASIELAKVMTAKHIPSIVAEIDAGPADVRPAFVNALCRLGGDEVRKALKPLLDRHDAESRTEAALSLNYLGVKEGTSWIVRELEKPGMPAAARTALITRVHGFVPHHGELKRPFAPAVARVLSIDKDEGARRQAMKTLGFWKDPETAPALRKVAANDDDPLQFDAIVVLMAMGDAEAIDHGIAALQRARSIGTANKILDALEDAGGKDLPPRLRALLDQPLPSGVLPRIIETLGKLRDVQSMPALVKLVDDPAPAVANAAADAVIALAGPGHVELLKKLLATKDPERRIRAGAALLALDDLSGLAALREGLADKDSKRRRAAIDGLGYHSRKEVVDLYVEALESELSDVRSAVASKLQVALGRLFPYRRFDLADAGYDPAAPKPEAVAVIRAWWTRHRP